MQERVTGAELTVLVVDDDATLLDFARDVIALLGHRVLCARSGVEALSTLQREAAVDVLFTDIRMPGMDGWELGRAANLARPEIEVIYTTGCGDPLPDGNNGRTVTLVRKPWRPSELENLFQRILKTTCRA